MQRQERDDPLISDDYLMFKSTRVHSEHCIYMCNKYFYIVGNVAMTSIYGHETNCYPMHIVELN